MEIAFKKDGKFCIANLEILAVAKFSGYVDFSSSKSFKTLEELNNFMLGGEIVEISATRIRNLVGGISTAGLTNTVMYEV